jgi:hypothetical protein
VFERRSSVPRSHRTSAGDAVWRATNTGPWFGHEEETLDFITCGTVEGGVGCVMRCVEDLFES